VTARLLPVLSQDAQRPLVLAASTGGHLAELIRLAPGLGAADDSLWITFRTPQSESLLRDRNVLFAPYVRPRDGRTVVQAFRQILPAIRRANYQAAVSTGAALALAALPAARMAGLPSLYVESVCRVTGPSLSGRILAKLRFAEMRTQHAAWAGGCWGTHPSVLSTYRTVPRNAVPAAPRKLFVTVGTLRGYTFSALIERICALGLANEDTVWQIGDTRPPGELPGKVYREISAEDFERYATEADAVVCHAGVGTVLCLFELGVSPVAVVRRAGRGEHVDDHQQQLGQLMRETGVGFPVELEELTREVVRAASTTRTSRLEA